jgi:Flp pilus assembly pilin Flp
MSMRARITQGAEAGAITAGAIEASFFVLDLVRLRPLETPAALSGAGITPAGLSIDLGSIPGAVDAIWATYQISMLTLAHFLTFAVAGVIASFAFDWRRAGGFERYGILAGLCAVALLATVSTSSSMGALGSLGMGTVVCMMLISPAILGSLLRVLAMPDESFTT